VHLNEVSGGWPEFFLWWWRRCLILAEKVVEAVSLEEVEIASFLITKLSERFSQARSPLQGLSEQFDYLLGMFLGFGDTFYILKNAFICYKHL